jgi:hypothetical protein
VPFEAQICHWYWYEIVPVPVHVPGDAVAVAPVTACPAIVGGDVFAGPLGAAAIRELAVLVAELDPSGLLPITFTRSVLPASPLWIVYVCDVAPEIAWQLLPSVPQICHWYWYVIGAEPFHVPGSALTLFPVFIVPVIVGVELFVGATAARDVVAAAVPTTTRATTHTDRISRVCRRTNAAGLLGQLLISRLLSSTGRYRRSPEIVARETRDRLTGRGSVPNPWSAAGSEPAGRWGLGYISCHDLVPLQRPLRCGG